MTRRPIQAKKANYMYGNTHTSTAHLAGRATMKPSARRHVSKLQQMPENPPDMNCYFNCRVNSLSMHDQKPQPAFYNIIMPNSVDMRTAPVQTKGVMPISPR